MLLLLFLSSSCIICGTARSKQRCSRLSKPPLIPCPSWLAGLSLPEPEYFTRFVSAIDSAVNLTPHPWKRFRILIPLPSPVHLNLNAFCKQDFMHDLPPSLPLSPSPSLSLSPCSPLPFLSHFLAYYLPPKESVEMASALVGSENVQCTIVAMEQTDRQAALPPLSPFLPFSRWPVYQIPQH